MLKQQVENVIATPRQGPQQSGVSTPANEYGQQVTEIARAAAAKSRTIRAGTKAHTMEVTEAIKDSAATASTEGPRGAPRRSISTPCCSPTAAQVAWSRASAI